MNVVPTLDAIAADPARVQGLPRQALLDLAVKVLHAHAAVTTALIAAPPLEAAREDLLIGARELAGRMGCSVNEVYRRKADWPFTIQGAGQRPRFSLRGFEAWVAEQDGRGVGSRRAHARKGA
jgi:hypothetical protein